VTAEVIQNYKVVATEPAPNYAMSLKTLEKV